ncbi:MAG: PQQ-binding-like beta-propeller repeat protein, partial [Halobacteriaceae archaeon]
EATTTGDGDGTGDGGATTTGDGGTTADGGTEETTAATGETGEMTTGGGTTTGGGLGDSAPMYQYDAANTGYNPSAAGPTSSATPAWSVETGDYLFDTPSVVGGNVYVGSADGTLYALDRGGNERWTYDAPAAVKRTAVGEGAVYLAYGDEKAGFAAVSTDGEELWTAAADDGAVGAPTVHDGTVYVTEYSGVVRAIDAASGKEQWRADAGTETPAT